jgi:hypothetical protein
MATPAELRERSRLYRQMAEAESETHLQQLLTSHALVLAQMADKIERDEDWLDEQRA